MRWPWQQVETRSVDYSDSLVQFLLNRAQGNLSTADANATAALESCVGAVGRAFAGADIASDSPTIRAALTADILEMAGRQLVRAGEIVFYLDSTGGDLNIIPAQSHNVMGGPTPSSWRYDLTLGGPSLTQSYRDISAERVIHLRYAAHPSTPWRGQSPLEIASLAGRLSASTVKALADESGGPLANLLGLAVGWRSPVHCAIQKGHWRSTGQAGDNRKWRLERQQRRIR